MIAPTNAPTSIDHAPVRAVVFGVGESAREIARQLIERGGHVVGAFSRTSGVGEDIGTYLGLRQPVGAVISNDPSADLSKVAADVAILATQSSLTSQLPLASLCLMHGLDVLSIAEEGFHPSATLRDVVSELDQQGLRAGKSVYFGGIQDVFWHAAPLSLLGGCHRVSSLVGQSVSNLDDLGAATAASYPLGLTAEQFGDAVADIRATADFFVMAPAVEAIAARLGLDVVDRTSHVEPVLATTPVYSEVLDTTIAAGLTCGLTEHTRLHTAAGVTISAEFVSAVLEEGRDASNKWTVQGDPSYEVVYPKFPGYEATAATLINRIPAVRAAAPGYRTVLDMPQPTWWPGETTQCSGSSQQARPITGQEN